MLKSVWRQLYHLRCKSVPYGGRVLALDLLARLEHALPQSAPRGPRVRIRKLRGLKRPLSRLDCLRRCARRSKRGPLCASLALSENCQFADASRYSTSHRTCSTARHSAPAPRLCRAPAPHSRPFCPSLRPWPLPYWQTGLPEQHHVTTPLRIQSVPTREQGEG